MDDSLRDLMEAVRDHLARAGWTAEIQDKRVVASLTAIASKWMLGKRTVRQDAEFLFDEGARTVQFKETATESVIGIPPLSFSVSKYGQSGTDYTETRVEKGIGGGGRMDYGRVAETVMALCAQKGFRLERAKGRIKNPLR
jgi:hypothetical protein